MSESRGAVRGCRTKSRSNVSQSGNRGNGVGLLWDARTFPCLVIKRHIPDFIAFGFLLFDPVELVWIEFEAVD